jgi:hypothetical protein
MKPWAIAAILASLAGPAVASDHEAGVPLQPSEAAGPWTLQANSDNRTVCVLDLGARRAGAGYVVRVRGDCSPALSAEPAAWAPTSDGMKLIAADGQTIKTFDRWSNSLFTTHINSSTDLQLRRGL